MDLQNFIAGHQLQLERKYRESIEQFNLALGVDSEFCYAYGALSVSYYFTGDLRMALEAADRAISIAPKISRFQYQRGVILYSLGLVAESVEAYSAAIEINNSHALYFCTRGLSNERLCRWDNCVEDFMRALHINKNCWEANLKIADVLATCDDDNMRSKSCLQYATRARQIIGNKDWRVFGVLAAAYAENGDWMSAERAAERALRLAPDFEQPRRKRRLDQIRARTRITRSNGQKIVEIKTNEVDTKEEKGTGPFFTVDGEM